MRPPPLLLRVPPPAPVPPAPPPPASGFGGDRRRVGQGAGRLGLLAAVVVAGVQQPLEQIFLPPLERAGVDFAELELPLDVGHPLPNPGLVVQLPLGLLEQN